MTSSDPKGESTGKAAPLADFVAEAEASYLSVGLPVMEDLPVGALAGSFQTVTNAYKFYWFWALLEEFYVETTSEEAILSFHQMVARMIALAWFPVHYFRLSFGRQDKLDRVIRLICPSADGENGLLGLRPDSKPEQVYQAILQLLASTQEPHLQKQIMGLLRYVPFRFLRPFLQKPLQGVKESRLEAQIVTLAASPPPGYLPLYRFVGGGKKPEAIQLTGRWSLYLRKHLGILRDFCLWRLVRHLQKRNPYVSAISEKLFAPQVRDLKTARTFWKLAYQSASSPLRCIYSKQPLQLSDFSLDHFLPWRFVAHDLLWNIIPTPQRINASKSDQLPAFDQYLSPFVQMQWTAVQSVGQKGKASLLEDYMVLLGVEGLDALLALSQEDFGEALGRTLRPQSLIAENMGFSSGWTYH